MNLHPLARRGAPHTVTWTDRIGSARSESEVVAVVREYLALVSPEEVAVLPAPCRPARIVDGSDIADYAFELLSNRSAASAEASDRVHRIATVMSFAATRLSALSAMQVPDDDSPGSRQPAP